MKITCERSLLANALGVAGRAVSSRNTLPILSHVMLETEDDRVKITATDLDTAIRCAIPASVAENGSVAIPAASLNDYVSKLPEAPVTLEMSDGKVIVRSGASRFTILCAPAEDFPVVPEVTQGTEVTVSAATLKEMLRMTAFAASREESRSLLMGVLFEARNSTLTLVATDTHRLAWKQAPLAAEVEAPVTAIVPAKPLVELERVLKNTADEMVIIRFGASQVQFQSPDAVLVSRVLDGQFPNYEKVIPKAAERKIVFEREELLNAVRRIDIVARANSQKMLLKTNSDRVILTAESPEAGQAYEEVPVTMDGSDLTIAFNSKYLMEVLGLLGDDQINLELNGPLNPGILRAGGEFLYVVMPMQA
jgi:DNA polymerase-3 subunit beta